MVDKSEKAVGSSDPEDNEESAEDKPQPSVAEQEVNIEYFKQKDYYRIISFMTFFPRNVTSIDDIICKVFFCK